MSEHIGLAVLRAGGAHLRTHPESWTVGAGKLFSKVDADPSYQWQPGDDCCIHTLIVYCGKQFGGEIAESKAIKILCEHHKLAKVENSSIHYLNDKMKSVKEAIEFIEAPLGTMKSIPDAILKALPVPYSPAFASIETPSRTKVLVAAMYAFILIGAFTITNLRWA